MEPQESSSKIPFQDGFVDFSFAFVILKYVSCGDFDHQQLGPGLVGFWVKIKRWTSNKV